MNDTTNENNFICNQCNNDVEEADEFCPNCGNLFAENAFCKHHPKQEAEGVCIICCEAYCSECGSWTNDLFLCADHGDYEIYEGMARVFGVSDESLAQYAHDCLKEAGLHPFLYYRKASPISIGGPSYTLFRASGEYDGHIINEIKLMVPCQELIQAEKVLRELDILN